MLPNCKQIAEQASENIDEPLTGMAWFKHKVHVLMCKHCARYVNQMELSSKTVSSLDEQITPNQDVKKHVEEKYRDIHCGDSSHDNN